MHFYDKKKRGMDICSMQFSKGVHPNIVAYIIEMETGLNGSTIVKRFLEIQKLMHDAAEEKQREKEVKDVKTNYNN